VTCNWHLCYIGIELVIQTKVNCSLFRCSYLDEAASYAPLLDQLSSTLKNAFASTPPKVQSVKPLASTTPSYGSQTNIVNNNSNQAPPPPRPTNNEIQNTQNQRQNVTQSNSANQQSNMLISTSMAPGHYIPNIQKPAYIKS
jgi:hypothetical protein